jgi:hypothetical protein
LIASVKKPTLCLPLYHHRQRRIIIHYYETQKLLRRTEQAALKCRPCKKGRHPARAAVHMIMKREPLHAPST